MLLLYKAPTPELLSFTDAMSSRKSMSEEVIVSELLESPPLSPEQRVIAADLAREWIEEIRKSASSSKDKNILSQYDLSSAEGLCLLSLAEALLRIPDSETINDLIVDKLSAAEWSSETAPISRFEALGLNLSCKFLQPPGIDASLMAKVWANFCRRTSGPVIRRALRQAMGMLSEEFILGDSIDAALVRAHKINNPKFRYSFDMLGEVARTRQDSERYFESYKLALKTMAEHSYSQDYSSEANILAVPSISVKLSSLHPRYEDTHWEEVVPELTARLLELATIARKANLGLTVDAEEADRLDMSLWIFSNVFADKNLEAWDGFGLAVQAYQKRAPVVLDYLAELAAKHNKRIPVRLIKGAYWDAEIKNSQVLGYKDYPVFTKRNATDLNYLHCAKKLISLNKHLPAQFGTHNAYTAAAVLTLIDSVEDKIDFEFQHLHGMGASLHSQLIKNQNIYSRVYAPVGVYSDLLPYLVRRLLENGANSAFVHQIANPDVPIEELIKDPVDADWKHKRHPIIPLPDNIYGARLNSRGVDLSDKLELEALAESINAAGAGSWQAKNQYSAKPAETTYSPSDQDVKLGQVYEGNAETMLQALTNADNAYAKWNACGVQKRAEVLDAMADALQEKTGQWVAMLSLEAGRLVPDAIDEVREAVDFCRYYADLAREKLVEQVLPGPTGEDNRLSYHGRGVVVCISPWNFPLAIFIGQIAAALVSGNTVVAKPAEQTSLIAAAVVDCCYESGLPKDVLHVVYGEGGELCKNLWLDKRVQGAMFTGSTEVATLIQQQLAQRDCGIIPLVAETGGINALIADSTALPEQLVRDVLRSAFNSAGQRCSALRVLCLQDDAADKQLAMLEGAMDCLKVGNPQLLETDVGPVIDADAHKNLLAYQAKMQKQLLCSSSVPKDCANGFYVAPSAYSLPHLSQMQREVFGPFLHVYRYKRDAIDSVVEDINAWGYGLTFGVHSRIESFVRRITDNIKVGNVYINRNIVGAVVGVQPFGGCGLSGTGPKAGGPDALSRLTHSVSTSIDITAVGGNATLLSQV